MRIVCRMLEATPIVLTILSICFTDTTINEIINLCLYKNVLKNFERNKMKKLRVRWIKSTCYYNL